MARPRLAEVRVRWTAHPGVIQTRPVSSNIGLCTFALLVQIGSVPQYGDANGTCCGDEGGMFGSRTVTGTRVAVWVFGSSTGM